MIIVDIFNEIFFRPILNLLILIIGGLESFGIPGALGLAIIILTILVRVVVWPFMTSQMKMTKKMADLKPHLDVLKQKHKDDKQSFAKAQMDLYKEHGVNPAGGCIPALIQFPIFIALVNTISAMFNQSDGLEHINSLLYSSAWHLKALPDPHFFGLNLAVKPSDFATQGILLLLIPVITGVLTFIQSKMAMPQPVKPYPGDSKKEVKEKVSTEDAMGQMQSQMVYMMPVMIAFLGFSFPVGLAFYWNTFTLIGILQQYLISGWGGMLDLNQQIKSVSKKIFATSK